MWKTYLPIIEGLSHLNTKDYCESFGIQFGIAALSLTDIEQKINAQNGNLFYQRVNIDKSLYEADLSSCIAYIEHYLDINWDFLFKNLTIGYEDFNDLLLSPLGKNIYLKPEKILSDNNPQHTLLFLFLYFLPCSQKHSLLFNSLKKKPLISFEEITIEHFNMLLYLMKKYERQELQILCQNYNLNCYLIESFFEKGYSLTSSWREKIPLEKMKILWDHGCTLKNSHNKFKNYLSSACIEELIKLENTYIYEKIGSQLPEKTFNKKVIKI